MTQKRVLGALQRAQQVGLCSGGLQSPRRGSVVGAWWFFMAAVGSTWLPHPRPGRATTVSQRLLIRQGGCLPISQLTSLSRGRCTMPLSTS